MHLGEALAFHTTQTSGLHDRTQPDYGALRDRIRWVIAAIAIAGVIPALGPIRQPARKAATT
jgi:hypothetical protein